MRLPDGTIVPTFQAARSTVAEGPQTEQFGQWGLRVGQVRDIILPKDKRSVSKKFIEYHVEVQHRDSHGRVSNVLYPNCFLASTFGGRGDKVRFTHRFAKKTDGNGVGEGSGVIIGHINGDRQQAVILGGIRDSEDETDDDKLGHNYFNEFNGVQQLIDNDGQYSVTFTGATNYDGTLKDGVEESNGGAFFKFLKNGNFEIVHDAQKLELKHAEKSWNMEAEENIDLLTKKGYVHIIAEGDVNIFGHGEISDMRLGVKFGRISLESNTGVSIGADAELATEHLILGDTWARQMTALCTALNGALSAATTALAAAAAGVAASAAGLSPVPPTAAAGAAAAAAALTAASTALAGGGSALANFQSQLPMMISKKNTCD